MNVTVENLGPCKKLVRVEVDAQTVETAFEAITKDFMRQAAIPGFRPGKAPRPMVVKRYEKDIAEEAKKKLTGDSYKQAIQEQNLKVYTVLDVEDVQFGRGQAMLFTVTLETMPEIELPEYRKLPAVREAAVVTDADVDQALEMLRAQHTKYETVARPLTNNDIAVINYSGTCEGQPISEVAPAAKGVAGNQKFWVDSNPSSFLPGFFDQLVGAQAGDKKEINISFPADFLIKELAGKAGVYAVEVVEIKEKVLPPVDDSLAKLFEAADLNALKAGVRRDLENELEFKKRKAIRSQVVQGLLNRANFELPETAVKAETRNVVYDIVSDSQRRGIGQEQIEKSKDEIYSLASRSAKDRVKATFLFSRIAEKETIKVTQEELSRRIYALAAEYQMSPDKFVKELEKREGLPEIHQQLLNEKVVDFLADNAEITDAAPAPAPAA